MNNTFYRLPEEATFKGWADRTPDDFAYAVKASRYLTHVKRLKDSREPVERLVDRIRHLGPKLGPVLLQLPPNLSRNPELLSEALDAFPSEMKLAVEFRHPSWFDDETKEVLASHSAALCLADRRGSASTPVWKTADWAYLRLHEGNGSPHPCYRPKTLLHWVEQLGAHWRPHDEVYVYFNNDPGACALADAIEFAEAGEGAGMKPTRVPGREEVKVSS